MNIIGIEGYIKKLSWHNHDDDDGIGSIHVDTGIVRIAMAQGSVQYAWTTWTIAVIQLKPWLYFYMQRAFSQSINQNKFCEHRDIRTFVGGRN